MNNKFELVADSCIEVFGIKLFRIRAKVAFGCVTKGELGGYVQGELNLSTSGNAWVSGDALVYGNARVYGDARVSGNARVYGDARVSGNARVSGDAWVSGDARVYGNASIFWASHVGSENGTITVCKSHAGLWVSRGCFSGTDVEFLAAVDERHGADSKIGREYYLLIEVARSRIDVADKPKVGA